MADAHYTGTYEPERKTEDLVYGVTSQLHSWNPVYIQVSILLTCLHHWSAFSIVTTASQAIDHNQKFISRGDSSSLLYFGW